MKTQIWNAKGLFLVAVSLMLILAGCQTPVHEEPRQPVAAKANPAPAKPAPMAAPAPAKPVVVSNAPAAPEKPAMVSPPAAPAPAPTGAVITLQRSAPAEILVGKTFEYQIVLRNATAVAVRDVTVTENLPASFQFESAVPQPTNVQPNKLTWKMDVLQAGQMQTLTVRGKASQEGTLENCANAVVCTAADQCRTIKVVQPRLQLVKTGPDQVILCDPIPVKLTVTNNGSGPATNVLINDTLPQGLKSQDGKTALSYNIGTLAPGQSRTVEAVLKADAKGAFTNSAVATADDGLRADASHKVTVVKPELAITKTGPAERFLGKTATYDISLTNTGDAPANNTVLTDTLPAGMAFVSASEGGQFAGGKVTWNLGTLAAGASKNVSLTARADQMGTMKNLAGATAYCAAAAAETVTEVRGIPAILLEVIDIEDPIEVGANETYVITVTNQGTATDTNITIVCTLPPQQQYVSGTGPTAPAVEGQVVRFAPLASLAPKAQAVYKVTVKAVQTGDVRFHTEMNSDQIKSPVMETEATNIYQ